MKRVNILKNCFQGNSPHRWPWFWEDQPRAQPGREQLLRWGAWGTRRRHLGQACQPPGWLPLLPGRQRPHLPRASICSLTGCPAFTGSSTRTVLSPPQGTKIITHCIFSFQIHRQTKLPAHLCPSRPARETRQWRSSKEFSTLLPVSTPWVKSHHLPSSWWWTGSARRSSTGPTLVQPSTASFVNTLTNSRPG